jgi:hypothetical protein
LILLAGCLRTPPVADPLPVAPFDAAEAEARARVADPARGGPAIPPDASPLPPFLGVSRASATYVGVAVCASCHDTEAVVWRASAHSTALTGLEAAGRAHDPRCFRCHVTGFGHPGGFPSGQLGSVGCEACHGPGSDHVAAPARGWGELPRSGAACVACHTWENAPEFRFDAAWERVRHGG